MGLNYYADMKDALLPDPLRQVNIKTEKNWWPSLILVGKIVQTLVAVQEHILTFIKDGKLTMADMLQNQLLNQVHKVSTLYHALQGRL